MPHVIRLNRAWEYRLLASADASAASLWHDDWPAKLPPAAGRIDLPVAVAGDSHPARSDLAEPGTPGIGIPGFGLLLTRHFNRPSNLDASQQVLLTIRPAAMVRRIYLNESELATGADEHDCLSLSLGPMLQRYNRLDILIAAAQWLSAADVRLVIDDHAQP